jgi:hypothetical protein
MQMPLRGYAGHFDEGVEEQAAGTADASKKVNKRKRGRIKN